MPIYTRSGAVSGKDDGKCPPSLVRLFSNVLSFGTILPRKEFISKYLPMYEKQVVNIRGQGFSIRPAWICYKPSGKSHVMVIGHILFCHAITDKNWYYQPSTRLFSEDTQVRLRQFRELLERVNKQKSKPSARRIAIPKYRV